MQASGRSLAWSDSPQGTQRNTSARKRRTVGRVVCANATVRRPPRKAAATKPRKTGLELLVAAVGRLA
jgi:hypothetical protein